jgi:hypothetical protein
VAFNDVDDGKMLRRRRDDEVLELFGQTAPLSVVKPWLARGTGPAVTPDHAAGRWPSYPPCCNLPIIDIEEDLKAWRG